MKRWLTLTILVVTGLSALLLADREYRAQLHLENARALAQASAGTQNRMQFAFVNRLRVIQDLQAFMLASASLPDNETFDRYAAGVLDHYPTIRGLAYIDSNRIVRYFYPLKGNEAAIGLDLMTRPAAPFVEKAIRERSTTVNDPVVNVMGSLAVTPRTPLYRGDQLLGLVQGVFDVSAILEEVSTGADPRFAAQLRDANGRRFWGPETFSGETQTLPVQIGDNAWTLTVGWQSPPPGPAPLVLVLIWGAGGALLLSLLFIVNRTRTQTEWLRATVSNRTAALHKSEERYRFMAENARDMIYRMSLPDGRYEYVSPSSTALFGYSPDEFYNSPLLIQQAIHPDWRGYFEKAWADLVNGIAPPTYEYQIIHKSGETRWLNQRNVLLKNESGAPIAIQGIVTDITERKQAEKALVQRTTDLERANRALRTLSACNETLVRAGTEFELLNSVCRLIVETGGYRMVWVGFAEQDPARTVRAVAQYGFEEGYLETAKISWADTEYGQGLTGTAIRAGEIQVNQNILTNPRMAPWRDAALQRGYQSSIALPLKSSAGVLGALTLYSEKPDAFSEAEIQLLQELAEDLAFGVESLRTKAERDRMTYAHLHHEEILRKSLEESIQAISDTVEMRDPYTAGHQKRVAKLAVAIASDLELPKDEIHGIHLAASIHDLGKIQIPAEILSKPSKLTDIEFMLIRTHAQTGYNILKGIEFPWPVANIVLQHHERLDGSGYPQGLKGDQIQLGARILAVADVVEAMASHRPYRPALGIDKALAEIERGRGSVYDPVVADACLRLFREKRYQLPA